jgi:hypothetical protein
MPQGNRRTNRARGAAMGEREEFRSFTSGARGAVHAGRSPHPRTRAVRPRACEGRWWSALEVLAHELLEEAEMTLGQVLEPPPTAGQGGLG